MSNVARSGITTDAQTGERYIPSSVRADGSKRKEIRVRPGYKPPEDIELYKNRAAAAWKSRAKGGVPGAEALSTEDKTKTAAIPTATTATAASNKNAKRREAKRNAKETEEAGPLTEGKGAESSNWRVPAPAPKKQEKPAEELVDPEAEREKKARNLKKKLRQARDLRDKKQQGEALLPEQLEKVIKIQELVRQLDVLGFDSNGDKKNGDSNENA
jgi:partner of Y14 and mago protein